MGAAEGRLVHVVALIVGGGLSLVSLVGGLVDPGRQLPPAMQAVGRLPLGLPGHGGPPLVVATADQSAPSSAVPPVASAPAPVVRVPLPTSSTGARRPPVPLSTSTATPPSRPRPVPPPRPQPSPVVRVAAFALAQVGLPYVAGAAGPRAYDCSGLTVAAYRTAGVALPHSAAAQVALGVAVDWRHEP